MDLPLLVATARRHLWLLLASALLGMLAGGAYLGLATPLYRSSSEVLFSLDRGSSVSELAEGTTFVQDLAPSYAVVATAPVVLEPVIHDLKLPYTATQLARHVTATIDQGGLIMQLQVDDPAPQRATAIAEAMAQQLARAVPALSVQAPGQARVSVTVIPGSVTAATPSSPGLATGLGAGAVLGLLFSAGLTTFFEVAVFSPPVHNRRTTTRIVSAPVLASVPDDADARQVPLPVNTHPHHPRAESYRLLQTGIDLVHSQAESLALVVCAPGRGDGATTTAVNLAVALSTAGRRVLLVDADLRSPRIGELLGFGDGAGLTDVLTSGAAWRDQIRGWRAYPPSGRQLDVLTARPVAKGASDLIASPDMSGMLLQARTQYDVVIVDCPDLHSVTDAAAVAAQADHVLLVLDARTARQRPVDKAVQKLRMAGGRILGVVMNRTGDQHAVSVPVAARTSPQWARSGRRSLRPFRGLRVSRVVLPPARRAYR